MSVHQAGTLVSIKQVREQSRRRSQQAALGRLDAARQTLRTRTEERLDRDKARSSEEQGIFDDLCSRLVSPSDLLLVQHRIDCMKNEARDDLHKQQEAERSRDQAEEQLREARQALATERIRLSKASSLHDDLRLREMRQMNRAEDVSFEEDCELIHAARRARPGAEEGPAGDAAGGRAG